MSKDQNPRPKKPADSEPVFVSRPADVIQSERPRDAQGRIKHGS